MGCVSTKPPPTNLTASSKSAAYAAQLRARQAALHNLSSFAHYWRGAREAEERALALLRRWRHAQGRHEANATSAQRGRDKASAKGYNQAAAQAYRDAMATPPEPTPRSCWLLGTDSSVVKVCACMAYMCMMCILSRVWHVLLLAARHRLLRRQGAGPCLVARGLGGADADRAVAHAVRPVERGAAPRDGGIH